MRRMIVGAVILGYLSSGPAFAWEGGGEGAHAEGTPAEAAHEGVPWAQVGQHAFNLAVLFGVLAWATRGRLGDALRSRALGVKREIDEANQLRKEARARFEDLDRQLAGFDDRLVQMKQSAEAEARREHDALMARAEYDARLIVEGAERTIRDEVDRARLALRREAAELALGVASGRLREEIRPEDDERLAQQFLGVVKPTEVADG